MEINQIAAPAARMASAGRSLGRSRSARMLIITNIGSASAETGTEPTREKRLESTLSQPLPLPHPGIESPLNEVHNKNAARTAARSESIPTAVLVTFFGLMSAILSERI